MDIVQRAYTPSIESIKWARELIHNFKLSEVSIVRVLGENGVSVRWEWGECEVRMKWVSGENGVSVRWEWSEGKMRMRLVWGENEVSVKCEWSEG